MGFLVPTESASAYGFAHLRIAEHGLRSSVAQPCPLEDCSVFVFNIKGVSNHGLLPFMGNFLPVVHNNDLARLHALVDV